ncbi:MAG: hypothetical protein LQ340_005399 [Diploschistes diacapsis]|nr:MAG: hypothetical protein LQ340_005399 [Diploschistes diacapsis]
MASATPTLVLTPPWTQWLSCAVAILCNTATLALEILLAVAFSSNHGSITVITCVALAFEASSLGVLLVLCGRDAFRRAAFGSFLDGKSYMKHGHLIFGVLLSAIAAAVTVGVSIWMAVNAAQLAKEMDRSPWGFVAALLATTILSTLFRVLFFVLLSRVRPSSETLEESRSMPEISQTPRPDTSKSTIVSNPFTNRKEASSPPTSRSSISLRSSFTLPSRDGSSKTRLAVSRPSSKSTDAVQLDFAWDTSSVPPSLRDAVYSHTRTTATPLAPIPGSRPVSPAKALDGPFLPPSPHPPLSQPSSPMEATFSHPSSPTTTTAHAVGSVALSPPQAPFMLSNTPNRSRTTSLASRNNDSPDPLQLQNPRLKHAASATSLAESVSHLKAEPSCDEENIHPLFRAASPIPPPSASRNTILRAATISDAEEAAIVGPRRRAESRVGSPLAMNPQPSIESPELFTPNGPREEPAWPLPASRASVDESADAWKDGDRPAQTPTPASTPSQDTIASTPEERNDEAGQGEEQEGTSRAEAIPSFVLAAGSRGSMLNFESRQRKSEYSTNDE